MAHRPERSWPGSRRPQSHCRFPPVRRRSRCTPIRPLPLRLSSITRILGFWPCSSLAWSSNEETAGLTMPEMRTPSVSLVIPMFNEEENIEHAVDAAVEALTKYTDDYEIVIVDDASSDSSPMLVARPVAENPRVRMLPHETNRR